VVRGLALADALCQTPQVRDNLGDRGIDRITDPASYLGLAAEVVDSLD
jgi:hypothetical protein